MAGGHPDHHALLSFSRMQHGESGYLLGIEWRTIFMHGQLPGIDCTKTEKPCGRQAQHPLGGRIDSAYRPIDIVDDNTQWKRFEK